MAKNKNHHLIQRGNTWYFRTKVNGKMIKKALSESVTEARRQRDQFLKEMAVFGDIPKPEPVTVEDRGPLFGEVAMTWARIKEKEIKAATMRDYKSAMNLYVLPHFGNRPIKEISYLDIEEFRAELDCTAKRINNILVPMRSVFKMAYKNGLLEDNVMLKVDNLRTDRPSINPLTIDEVRAFLEAVHPHYRNMFTTLFFTGLRFGEMAALKWENVNIDRKYLHICETLVYGIEGRPKTPKSFRDVDMLPPVLDAIIEQAGGTHKKSSHVFLDWSGHPVKPDHARQVIWTPALKKAGISYRPMLQTRHTFATMMIDAGEDIGWVQGMLGHSSLQMIFNTYYSWIKKATRNDGSAFMKNFYEQTFQG